MTNDNTRTSIIPIPPPGTGQRQKTTTKGTPIIYEGCPLRNINSALPADDWQPPRPPVS